MTRVTLDSNVYLSGFVFGGKPQRILEPAIDGEIEVAVSDPILQEVRRHLLGKFGWSEPRVAEAIENIAEFANHVTPREAIDTIQTDPDDNRVLECAVSAGSQTIVTGDDAAPARGVPGHRDRQGRGLPYAAFGQRSVAAQVSSTIGF